MTAMVPVATVNGCRLFDDGLGGLQAYRDQVCIGVAFPQPAKRGEEPSGRWFAKRYGRDAQLFDTRIEALRWLTKETR